MRARRLASLLSLVAVPAIASAQQTASDSLPHSGTWGAEVYVGSGPIGANLLRFQSSRLALVLGAEFVVAHIDNDDDTGFPAGQADRTQTNVGGRFGLRTYRESSSEKLRPVVGFGVRSSYGKSGLFKNWNAGVYGELGATYFLTPHLSLGGSGELQASYGKQQQTISPTQVIEQTITRFDGSLMRVALAVYF